MTAPSSPLPLPSPLRAPPLVPRRIAVLSDAVAERVAAGEVIEHPAAVVKELVENALDAGARRIAIDVRGGGLESIRVADDGHGIAADQVSLAFTRHATSKLRDTDDLLRVTTLGFRGEALPSIAAVADVTLHTATTDDTAGIVYRVRHGETGEETRRARSRGTTVTVRDLFAAFPARRRFLKSPRVESGRIGQLVRRLALACPAVAFSLTFDGHTSMHTPGTGVLSDAAAALFGPPVAAHLLPLGTVVPDGAITGLIGDRAITKSGRAATILIVNGRAATCTALLAAFEAAYRPLLPRGRHPLAVLHLTVPPGDVDVNVHPAKAEIRLLHANALGAALADAVRATLGSLPALPPPDSDFSFLSFLPDTADDATTDVFSLNGARTIAGDDWTEMTLPASNLPPMRLLGQLDGRLLLAEGPDGLYLIDQHRAHERVIYEHLRTHAEMAGATAAATTHSDETEPEPLVLTLSPADARRLAARQPELAALGVVAEAWGKNTVLLRSPPPTLAASGAPAAVLLGALAEADDGAAPDTDAWQDRLRTALSCRTALRRGEPLSRAAMVDLVRRLGETPTPAVCPHGSPIVLHVGSGFLIKQFGWD